MEKEKHNVKRGANIGRLLVVELNERDSYVFDKLVEVLKSHSTFEEIQLNDETVLSLSGIEIYLDSRKVYCNKKEINLTTKEYDLLHLLVVNKGRVLTYEQIYRKIWGETAFGNERNAIGCHIRKLREKLYEESLDFTFAIRCVCEVGYCLEEILE